jgi:hypothetical protein
MSLEVLKKAQMKAIDNQPSLFKEEA